MRRWLAGGTLGLLLLGCASVFTPATPNGYSVDGTRLFMSGEINRSTPDSFAKMIEANPQVQTVVLMDMPGSVDEVAVHETGYFIRQRGLDTHLTSQSEVYSGAVDLFLAGNRRSMTCCAVIGVHDWEDDWGVGSEYPEDAWEHDANIAYFKAMLGSDAMYWFTLQAASPDEIHVMTQQELARFGVLNAPARN